MDVRIEAVDWPADAEAVVDFLVSSSWPFHGAAYLSTDDAARLTISSGDVDSFWLRSGDERVGLIRLLDLGDVGEGSPRFDLRITDTRRGSGLGTSAVTWLTGHLFTTYPELHRVEATTRSDNLAMQAVLDRCGYRREGRFVEAWRNADGTYADALSYAILRREWASTVDGGPGRRAGERPG